MNLTKSRGFTLLELLLVVGIAAVLIIGGITGYSMINRGIMISETAKVINLMISQARRLNASSLDYGPPGTDLEPMIANSHSMPQQFILGDDIVTPFNKTDGGVVFLASVSGYMSIDMALPPAYLPEIATHFDPNRSAEITFLRVCGTAIPDGTPLPDVATLSNACGNGRNALALNFTLVTQ